MRGFGRSNRVSIPMHTASSPILRRRSDGLIRPKATFGDAPLSAAHLLIHRSFAMAPSVRFLLCAAMLALPLAATAEESDHGNGHDAWHAEFYSKLLRPDTKT